MASLTLNSSGIKALSVRLSNVPIAPTCFVDPVKFPSDVFTRTLLFRITSEQIFRTASLKRIESAIVESEVVDLLDFDTEGASVEDIVDRHAGSQVKLTTKNKIVNLEMII